MNVTIVGGGFGGVKTALQLAKNPDNQITLISDKPDFQYYPALYDTATGHRHLESWVPLGEIFANKDNIHVILDSIEKVDPEKKTITGASGAMYPYQQLVLALGAVTTYFGIEGLDTYAFGIKSEQEIKRLKEHLYREMGEKRQIDKHYVVVGGGPTGVELASSLGTYLERLRVYHGLPSRKIHIDLVEAAPRVLPRMSEATSRAVEQRLKKLGVRVETGKMVQSATKDTLMVSGKPIKSQTVIWTSGVANHPFYKNNSEHFELAKNGKVVVDDYMRTKDGIYVIGDNAATPYSGLAQVALHDAIFVAANLERQRQGRSLKSYRAVMPPVVVPVGENWAVFEWKKLRLSGWIAALIRRVADVVGYSDILPLGQALGVWHAQRVLEDDYFTPSPVDIKQSDEA